jgi:pentatricopeptide repeat protein
MQILLLLVAFSLQLACTFVLKPAPLSGKWKHAHSFPAAQVTGSEDAKERQDQYTFNAQVQALGRANDWQGVIRLLDEAKVEKFKPNSHAWRAAIQAMGTQWGEAVKLIDRMTREGTKPNLYHYNAALSVCARAAQSQQAAQLFAALQAAGMTADIYTYNAMITAYGSGNQWQKAEQMFAEIQSKGFEPDLYSYSAMITAYGNGKQWQKAEQMFAELQRSGFKFTVILYSAMVAAYCKCGEWQLAVDLVMQMQQSAVKPNLVTYGTLIETLQKSDQIHAADEVYRQTMNAKLVNHWHTAAADQMYLKSYSSSMALAAIRLVLHNMKAASSGSTAALHSDRHMHDVKRDLNIATGYGSHSAAKNCNVLQQSVLDMLKQLGISCYINASDKGVLTIPSQQLVAYCTREVQS